MITIWICVALTALASFAIKAAAPAILGNRPLPSGARGVIALLAPALLAGLVISDILGPHWSSADGALAPGVLTAAASRTTGLPAPACIILAVAVTAVRPGRALTTYWLQTRFVAIRSGFVATKGN